MHRYSITSSARCCKLKGTSMPSATTLAPLRRGFFCRAQVRSDENNERSVSGWPLMPEPLCASPRWRARTLRRQAISNKLAPHAVSDRGLSEGRYRTTLIAWGVPSGTPHGRTSPASVGLFRGLAGQKKRPALSRDRTQPGEVARGPQPGRSVACAPAGDLSDHARKLWKPAAQKIRIGTKGDAPPKRAPHHENPLRRARRLPARPR